MIVMFLLEFGIRNNKVKFITELITDYLEELSAVLQYNYLTLSHFHYQSHSIPNVKNHTTLKNN